jgi:hypothetical protein
MQITINLDAESLNGTFLQAFNDLSKERKEEIVTEILREWLKESFSKENNYNWRSPVRPVHDAIGTLCDTLRAELIERAKTDESLRKYADACLEVLKERMPEFALIAVQKWFAQHMVGILNELGRIETDQINMGNVIEDLRGRLNA